MRILALIIILAMAGTLAYLFLRFGTPDQDETTVPDRNLPLSADGPTDTEEPSGPSDPTNGNNDATDPSGPVDRSDAWKRMVPQPDLRGLPEVYVNPRDGLTYLLVRGGFMYRGSDQTAGRGEEQPYQEIYVSPFYISQTTVTRFAYEQFMNDDGYGIPQADGRYLMTEWWSDAGWTARVSSPPWRRPAHWEDPTLSTDPFNPVVGVSWFEAEAFANWAGARLPREVEWEFAARGTDGRIFPWGNDPDPVALNWNDGAEGEATSSAARTRGEVDGYATLAPVDAFEMYAAPSGAIQMSGNVWEWTADWYDREFFPNLFGADRIDPNNVIPIQRALERGYALKVMKGGSWRSSIDRARAAARYGQDFTNRADTHGFRLVLDVEDVPRD